MESVQNQPFLSTLRLCTDLSILVEGCGEVHPVPQCTQYFDLPGCLIPLTYTGLPPLTRYDTTSASNIGVYLSSAKPGQKNKVDKQKKKKNHIIKIINTNFLFGITERLGTGRRPGPASAVKPAGIPVGYVISTDTLQQEFSPQN